MKHINLFLTLLLVSLLCKAQQPLVGALNSTLAISPSATVANSSSYTLTGSAVNVGSVTINGDVHVNLGIDTSSTGTPKYFWRKTVSYPVTNFLPNQSFNFSIGDVASNANSYKVAGNGTTVVVWFAVGLPNDSLTCADSAYVTIYIPLSQSLSELQQIQQLLQTIPNPLTHDVEFKNRNGWTIELIDMQGKIIEIKNFKLEILNYSKGLYLLRVRNETGNEWSKKIIIE